MTRGRFRAAAALLAIAVLGLLAWLLFPGREGVAPAPGETGAAARKTVSPTDTPSRLSSEAPAGGAAPPASEAEADAADAGAAPAAERWIEGTCVLEDGKPLAGVRNISARLGTGDFVRTGTDGRFRLGQHCESVDVWHPHAEVVSVEGGELRESPFAVDPKACLVIPSAERLRIVHRDRPGTAHVRLVNADTNEPVTNVDGLRVAYRFAGGSLTYGVSPDPGLGGWIPIPEGRLPEIGADPEGRDRDLSRFEVDASKAEVEIAMPGFEKATLPLPEIRGRMEVRVRPVPPDATGEVVDSRVLDVEVAQGEFIADPPAHVTATLRWMGPDPAPQTASVQGLPVRVGKFALYDLPDGPWHMEVAGRSEKNTVVRGGRAFEFRGAPVDLGRIDLKEAGRVVLRVVDAAGEAIPQAWAVVVRPEESPDQGRRLDLDDRGTVSVGDLEPGVVHRAVVKGLPQEQEQSATAEAKPKPVEFRWPERIVPCRITILVDGKAVANPDGRKTIPAVVQESPLPREKGAWGADGTFEAKLVPGTYRFSVLATPKEGGDPALFSGEVTVPAGDAYETRLELRRDGR